MNYDDMKNSLIEFIKENEEIEELTEISENDIIEEVDKQLKKEDYEAQGVMNERWWHEFYLAENELEVLKKLNELHKNRLDEKNKKIKKAAMAISLRGTVIDEILELFNEGLNEM
tara:strand:- start:93 stop:437 length:345 start_codon:yes stop_codon:yes gene_type:complete